MSTWKTSGDKTERLLCNGSVWSLETIGGVHSESKFIPIFINRPSKCNNDSRAVCHLVFKCHILLLTSKSMICFPYPALPNTSPKPPIPNSEHKDLGSKMLHQTMQTINNHREDSI
jgi:hypothetical protein